MHSRNKGIDNALELIGNISTAMIGSAVMQGGLTILDGATGRLSTSVLELLLLDGALQYGAKQIATTGTIRIGSNIWRNKDQIRNTFS